MVDFASVYLKLHISIAVLMEGYMYKWTNYVYGWKKRYFVLHNGVLQYCKEKGQARKGALHLNIAQVQSHSKNPCRIIVDSGTTVLHLKTNTQEDALQWLNALRAAQELLQKEVRKEELRDMLTIAPALEGQSALSLIAGKVSVIWDLQAQLEDLIPQFDKVPGVGKLTDVAIRLKTAAAEVLTLVEEEHTALTRAGKDTSRDRADRSFGSEEGQDLFFDALDGGGEELQQVPVRKCLPVARSAKARGSLWKVLKDSVGKELGKIAVPLSFHEPLSLLQRLAEDLTFTSLLLKANQSEDQWMRMAYVACFAVSAYSSTLNRCLKPFEAILGETFELEQEGMRLICEQVSRHPDITALHCDHEDFTFWANIALHSSFKGTFMQINPVGDLHVVLKRHSDHFVWNKVTTTVHNLLTGKAYVDNHGTIDLMNMTTNDRCRLTMQKLGWFEKSPNQVQGSVLDPRNTARYEISGTWSDHFIIKSAQGHSEVLAWELPAPLAGTESSYFFPQFALQLNISPDQYPKPIVCTDSRYRPDLRALEAGDLKTAAAEKVRIEEKQRAARKLREAEKADYKPRWFEPREGEWRYLGGYWEAKDSGSYGESQSLY